MQRCIDACMVPTFLENLHALYLHVHVFTIKSKGQWWQLLLLILLLAAAISLQEDPQLLQYAGATGRDTKANSIVHLGLRRARVLIISSN